MYPSSEEPTESRRRMVAVQILKWNRPKPSHLPHCARGPIWFCILASSWTGCYILEASYRRERGFVSCASLKVHRWSLQWSWTRPSASFCEYRPRRPLPRETAAARSSSSSSSLSSSGASKGPLAAAVASCFDDNSREADCSQDPTPSSRCLTARFSLVHWRLTRWLSHLSKLLSYNCYARLA